MQPRFSALVCVFTTPFCLAAEPADPEEIVVVGQRTVMELRLQMWEAERAAYEVFNAFNDEKRFDISCNAHQLGGTRIERQLCQPEFEIQAQARHARGTLESFQTLFGPLYLASGSAPD